MIQPLNQYDFIDVHYHANPDLYNRRHTALEAGRLYQKHNGLVVLKSHLGSTSVQASLAQAEGYPVLPSLVLNHIAGGLKPNVVIQALLEYKPLLDARMIVHLPTITGRKHRSVLKREISHTRWEKEAQIPLTVFDKNKRLKPEIDELFRLCNNEPIILSTGHASKEETYALIERAEKYAHARLMLNQPANPMTGLYYDDLVDISRCSNVFIEQTLLTYALGYQTELDFKLVLTQLDHVIYSSDFGQTSQAPIDEFISNSKNYFKTFSLTNQRVEILWKTNPIKLLTL